MEGPLVALSENVGGHFLRIAIVVRQKMVLFALGIQRINVRNGLNIGSRQVPGKPLPPRADAELAFREVYKVYPASSASPREPKQPFG